MYLKFCAKKIVKIKLEKFAVKKCYVETCLKRRKLRKSLICRRRKLVWTNLRHPLLLSMVMKGGIDWSNCVRRKRFACKIFSEKIIIVLILVYYWWRVSHCEYVRAVYITAAKILFKSSKNVILTHLILNW